MKKNIKVINIVHCVDTEGPLNETLKATFNRIFSLYNLKIQPTKKNLIDILNQNKKFKKIGKLISKTFNKRLLTYLDSFSKINKMLNNIESKKYRNSIKDDFGNGWIFNWFCMDHVNFKSNPRKRVIGYHKIFDFYINRVQNLNQCKKDAIHFHFHPHSISNHAHHSGTHWWSHNNSLYQILSRRIIDRMWFPCSNRPGFHVIRPESHWFLEQFIPFDFSNQSNKNYQDDLLQSDVNNFRFGNWNKAPQTWTPYHPDHNDYQKKGKCNRIIVRCLNVGTRHNLLKQTDVDKAFKEAKKGNKVLLAFTNHDFREMKDDIEQVKNYLDKSKKKYGDVLVKYCEAASAVRDVMKLDKRPACKFKIFFKNNLLTISTKEPTFGPQPFFTIKDIFGKYHHDNLNFIESNHEWNYVFDENTIPLKYVESVGIASNNKVGVTTVTKWNNKNKKTVSKIWNQY